MKKIEFILFFGFCFLGISKAIYSQKQDTVVIKDSISSPINFQEKRGTDILYRGVSL